MNSTNKSIALWLFTSAFMVFAMAVIGAITRLTESGLSMVEWRPLIGAIPPLSEVEWQRVFNLYRQTPEYIHKNAGMTLDEFKYIFFWEWFHRLWGRLIGLVYAVPFFYFVIRRRISKQQFWPLFRLLILGGLQGVMGWYMVMSGLVDRPSVSHFRLAAHLSLAFLIFALLVRLGLQYLYPTAPAGFNRPVRRIHMWQAGAMISFALTFVWGAFVAGMDAGLIYNEFPLMGGRWVPSDLWYYPVWWQNLINNQAGVQFVHRVLAMITGVVVAILWLQTSAKDFSPIIQRLAWALFVTVLCQIALGILTLLSGVNIILATAHQAGALILLFFLVWHGFELKKGCLEV